MVVNNEGTSGKPAKPKKPLPTKQGAEQEPLPEQEKEPVGAVSTTPLTEERVREIVREELERIETPEFNQAR